MSCPLNGGPEVQILSSPPRARSSTDRASDYGSEGWGFESLRAHKGKPRLILCIGRGFGMGGEGVCSSSRGEVVVEEGLVWECAGCLFNIVRNDVDGGSISSKHGV